MSLALYLARVRSGDLLGVIMVFALPQFEAGTLKCIQDTPSSYTPEDQRIGEIGIYVMKLHSVRKQRDRTVSFTAGIAGRELVLAKAVKCGSPFRNEKLRKWNRGVK